MKMTILRSIFLIINYKTFILTSLSIASTWLCGHYGLVADFPLNLVGIAIVFPVVFSIDSAYKRRESALGQLSDLRAHMVSLYQASRDWLDPKHTDFSQEVRTKIIDIYSSLSDTFIEGSKNGKSKDKKVFKKVSELSAFSQQFRLHGLQVGEMSRVSQYISKMAVALERMRVILNYRTPITLRAYSKVFIYSFPVIYGPYFQYASEHYSPGLEYFMPVIFSFILVSLDNIQNHLENPFDQVGEDDIKFKVDEFEKMLD
ncbi:MAG: bestrophin family ion channel [Reichenbachiella sp.]|uniref:bestrophin family ion channel n=2 Tax=Reichenbachiella sp. TaxID=2184521 RepID=UPI0032666F59